MTTVFELFVPLFFYNLTTAVLTEVFPSSCSLLFCTGISALLCIPVLVFFQRPDSLLKESHCTAERGGISFSAWIPCLILISCSACIFFNSLLLLPFISECLKTDLSSVSEVLYTPPLWEQIAFTGFAIPVAEELIFRGKMFRVLRKKHRFFFASFVSAFFFGIYHGNLIQGIYAFCLGFMMNWTYEQIQTLKAPCLFHSAANLLSVFMTFFTGKNPEILSVPLLAAGTFFSFAGMWFGIRKIRRKKGV